MSGLGDLLRNISNNRSCPACEEGHSRPCFNVTRTGVILPTGLAEYECRRCGQPLVVDPDDPNTHMHFGPQFVADVRHWEMTDEQMAAPVMEHLAQLERQLRQDDS